MVSPPLSVVPKVEYMACSICLVILRANIEMKTCPMVRSLFLKKIGLTSSRLVFMVLKSRSTF